MKPDGSFVTKGDLLMEKLIVDHCRKIIKNCVIISEES